MFKNILKIGLVLSFVAIPVSAQEVIEVLPTTETQVVAVIEDTPPTPPEEEIILIAPAEEVTSVEETVVEEEQVSEPEPEVLSIVTVLPELSTDKDDYNLFETVTIFGNFFQPLQSIFLKIFGTDLEGGNYTENIQDVIADDQGSFTAKYKIDLVYRPFYTIIANNLLGEELAKTTFLDAPPGIDLEQCRNGATATPNDCVDAGGGSGWVTGNVGASQGHYLEGHSIPYRAVMANMPVGASVTLTLGYDIKHSGAHAIDYLTHYQRLEPHTQFGHVAETVNPISGVSGIAGTTTTFPIPAPDTTSSPVSGQPATSFNTLPAEERVMTLFGGTIANVTYDTNGDLNAAQSETRIAVTFTPASSNIVLSWGGHIATQDDWGVGNSAGGISGSPYHMRVIGWTLGNLGNQDRSLSAAVILVPQEGNIVIVKQTDPDGDAQSFEFDPSWGANFFLTDGNQNDSGPLVAGAYSVSEIVPAGWDLTSATCVSSILDTETPGAIELDPEETVTCTFNNQKDANIIIEKQTLPDGSGQVFDFDLSYGDLDADLSDGQTDNSGDLNPGTYSVAENLPAGWTLTSAICSDASPIGAISLQAGETVTCTFTNTQNGHIIVDKVTDPTLDPQSFNFTAGGAGYSNFSLTDSASPNNQEVAPGAYSISETVPAGWDLTSATCDQGETPASLDVGPGETVTCTFNNQKDANIIVEKQTLPDGSGQLFDFNLSYGDLDADLSDGQTDDSGDLVPGTYSVAETVPAGWDLTSTICTSSLGGFETVGSIGLTAGETVTCVFTNTQRGHVIIVKDAIPNNPQDFSFTGSGSIGSFLLDDDGNIGNTLPKQRDFEVVPGEYSVSETMPAGWQAESATCDSDETIESINVGPGETVTCIFENEKLAKIILVKNTIGGNDTFSFDMTGTGLPSSDILTTVANTDSTEYDNLNPDLTYSITETSIPAGWALTNAECTGTNTPASITPNTGEIITCTFTNNKPAAQIDVTPLTDANKIGDNHAITANVQVHNGNGTWGPAADGTTVTFSIINSLGATAVFVGGNTCNTVAGSCSITINSPTSGHVVVNASASPVVLTVSVPVSTGTGGDNSADAQKDYVNAKISIAQSATNEVDDPHTFTVTVSKDTGNGSGFGVASGEHVDFTLTDANGATSVLNAAASTCDDAGANTDGNGQCTIVFSSASAGTVTGHALATVNVGGVVFNLATNGVAPNSGDAVKTYVDAKISVTPEDATNQVNEAHTVTVTVMEDPGTGMVAASGETVTFTLVNNNAGATFVGGDDNCVTDGSGQCTVQINSITPGTVEIHASVDVGVALLIVHRETDGTHGSSQNGNKKYEGGIIIIRKVTVGGDAEFNFNFDYHGDVLLSNGESDNSGYIPTGNHTVSEDVIAGWDLTSATCDDGSDVSLIGLSDGETVTCTFTNTKRATITIVKDAQPNDAQNFVFGGTLGAFTLDDDSGVIDPVDPVNQWPNSQTFTNQIPGSFTITETLPNAFWEFGGVNCTGNAVDEVGIATGVIVTLSPGENVTCTFVNNKLGPTRTQGFWSTHLTYTTTILNTNLSGTMTIGNGVTHQVLLDTIGKVMGGFWSNIAKMTTKANRSALDKARMQLAQQLIATKLNCAAFGCPSSIQTMITTADTNYAGTNVSAILASASALDGYNNSGDTITVGPTGKADPKGAKAIANLVFWDLP